MFIVSLLFWLFPQEIKSLNVITDVNSYKPSLKKLLKYILLNKGVTLISGNSFPSPGLEHCLLIRVR
ncbi:MAG: hypothetical protein AYK18_16795 [Theionarchaea archaeon DG-70]|nr:MAG: hypothetical protein AYK18_16795 [Theionarchaea archaeon DG-70]